MPKPAQKRSSDHSKEGWSSILASDHDYDGGMGYNLILGDEEEFPSLPVTPTKPPLPRVDADNDFSSGNAAQTLANLINCRSDALQKMVEAVRVEMRHEREDRRH